MTTNNTKGYDADSKRAVWSQGDKRQVISAIAQIAIADTDGDTYILARNIPQDAIVSRIFLPSGSPATSGATDYDIGFYKSSGDDLGAVLDADALVDGASFTAARTYALDILGSNISPFDKTDTINDLLSLQADKEYQGGVHIVMTLNTAGSGVQDLDFDIELIMAG